MLVLTLLHAPVNSQIAATHQALAPEFLAERCLYSSGVRDQQKLNLLSSAREFASDSISALDLEEARLCNRFHVSLSLLIACCLLLLKYFLLLATALVTKQKTLISNCPYSEVHSSWVIRKRHCASVMPVRHKTCAALLCRGHSPATMCQKAA